MNPQLVQKDDEGKLVIASRAFSLDDVVMVHAELIRVPLLKENPDLPEEHAIERARQLHCDYVFIGGKLREPGLIHLTTQYLVVFYKPKVPLTTDLPQP